MKLRRPKRKSLFQSTLPVWGATIWQGIVVPPNFHFNPRSPCGERLYPRCKNCLTIVFQSTLPVWGATLNSAASCCGKRIFQSTLPVWGATLIFLILKIMFIYFNPRSPCGERHYTPIVNVKRINFNPRSPCGERRPYSRVYACTDGNFNPRSPCGERPLTSCKWNALPSKFQSTLPVWGATTSVPARRLCPGAFQSTLPVWGATSKQTKYSYLFCIKFIKIANISKAVVKKIFQNFYLRYLKRFFQVRSSWYFCVHLSFALFFQAISGSLNNECSFNVIAAFCAKMLNFCFIFVT